MMSTVDGKILTENWGTSPRVKAFRKLYETVHNQFDSQAWMCGRVTMEKDFTEGLKPKLKRGGKIERTDYVADSSTTSFAIAIDAKGKLGWEKNNVDGDHIIEVLTTNVKDSYLRYLQDLGISYLFAGDDEIDFEVAIQKLGDLFPIQTIMLEGGGNINGSVLKAGLVDELSLIVLPLADGSPNTPSVFDITKGRGDATLMTLKEVKALADGAVWMHYQIDK